MTALFMQDGNGTVELDGFSRVCVCVCARVRACVRARSRARARARARVRVCTKPAGCTHGLNIGTSSTTS